MTLAAVDDRPHVLYRFWDANGVLLYVGITADPWIRMKAHSKDKPWWDDVVNMTIQRFDSREAVLAAETAAIKAEKPLHNKTHNRQQDDQLSLAIPEAMLDWGNTKKPIADGVWLRTKRHRNFVQVCVDRQDLVDADLSAKVPKHVREAVEHAAAVAWGVLAQTGTRGAPHWPVFPWWYDICVATVLVPTLSAALISVETRQDAVPLWRFARSLEERLPDAVTNELLVELLYAGEVVSPPPSVTEREEARLCAIHEARRRFEVTHADQFGR